MTTLTVHHSHCNLEPRPCDCTVCVQLGKFVAFFISRSMLLLNSSIRALNSKNIKLHGWCPNLFFLVHWVRWTRPAQYWIVPVSCGFHFISFQHTKHHTQGIADLYQWFIWRLNKIPQAPTVSTTQTNKRIFHMACFGWFQMEKVLLCLCQQLNAVKILKC